LPYVPTTDRLAEAVDVASLALRTAQFVRQVVIPVERLHGGVAASEQVWAETVRRKRIGGPSPSAACASPAPS